MQPRYSYSQSHTSYRHHLTTKHTQQMGLGAVITHDGHDDDDNTLTGASSYHVV